MSQPKRPVSPPAKPHPAVDEAMAVLFLLALTFAVYNTALLPGQTFLPADILLLTPPWRQHSQELLPGFHAVLRPAWDPIFQFYPFRHYLAESLGAGRIPLWNPYAFAGTPFAADGQSAIFYPPNWLFAVLPPAAAFGWLAALHTFLAGWFFYLYGKRLGWGRTASLSGATVWMLCGVMVSWQMWQVIDAALCWLPLALYFWEGWRQTGDGKQRIGMAIALGMSLLAGHFQFAFYVWLTALAYALYRPAALRKTSWKALAAVAALGVGLAAVQVLATADLLTQSLRTGVPLADILAEALPASQLAMLVAPDLLGGQRDWLNHPYLGAFNIFELTVYCGAAALAFAAYGLRLKVRGDLSRFWLALAVFALLMGCGSPLYRLFFYGLPGFASFHGPARIFALFSFAVAALCGQGIQRLISVSLVDRRRFAVRLIVALTLLLGLAYRLAVTSNGMSVNGIDIGQRLTHDWLNYGLLQMGRALLFVVLACALIGYAPIRWAWLALPLVAADMLLFAVGFNLGMKASLLYPPTPETQFVSANLADGRILSLGDANPRHAQSKLVPDAPMALDWPDINGYDPLGLKRYQQYFSTLSQAQHGSPVPEDLLADIGRPLLDRLNVRYVISAHPLSHPALPLALPGDVNVYQNTQAAGEARLVSQWRIVPDEAAALKQLPTSHTVLLNADPDISPPSGTNPATVTVASYTPGNIRLHAESVGRGVLVTSEVAAPGWQVSVDGGPALPLIADTLFLAVPLQAGSHTIALRYLPAPIGLGLYLSCLSWGIVAGALGKCKTP